MKKVFIKREPPIPFTREGYEKVLQEKEELLRVRPEAVENLRKAREMGDLRENGYYKAARQRLSFVDAQLRRLERLVRYGKIVESSHRGIVEIGSTVTITDGTTKYEYTVVGGYESNPSEKTISHISPLGRALMGKKQGDVALVYAPAKTLQYTIEYVS
jgi:transcription elongation factor GreA